jgi:hypothetical protein
MITIYGLIDPRVGVVRYVGKTGMRPQARLNSHITAARRSERSHRRSWIRSLLRDNVVPRLVVIDEVDDSNANEAESAWIAYYGRLPGYHLTNGTAGGDSGKMTDETRARCSEAQRLRWLRMGEDERRLVREHMHRLHTDPVMLEHARLARRLRFEKQEAHDSASEAQRRRFASPAERLKIKESRASDHLRDGESRRMCKLWNTKEYRERMLAINAQPLVRAQRRRAALIRWIANFCDVA